MTNNKYRIPGPILKSIHEGISKNQSLFTIVEKTPSLIKVQSIELDYVFFQIEAESLNNRHQLRITGFPIRKEQTEDTQLVLKNQGSFGGYLVQWIDLAREYIRSERLLNEEFVSQSIHAKITSDLNDAVQDMDQEDLIFMIMEVVNDLQIQVEAIEKRLDEEFADSDRWKETKDLVAILVDEIRKGNLDANFYLSQLPRIWTRVAPLGYNFAKKELQNAFISKMIALIGTGM